MLKVKCPNCGKRFKVAEKYAGQEAACTGCAKPIIIPMPESDPLADLGDLELDLDSPEGMPATTQDEIGTEADMEVDFPDDDEAVESDLPRAASASDVPAGKTFVSIPAFVAIGLGAVALIPVDANAFTYMRMPLSALGLIVGMIALVTSLADRRVAPVLPIVSVLIAGASVAMAVTGNVKLGLANMADDEPVVEVVEPEQPVEPVIVEAPPPTPVESTPAALPPRTVAVSLGAVRIASVEYHNETDGRMEKTDKAHLAITLHITNNGDAPANYITWAGIPGSYSLDIAALEDETGRAYRRVKMGRSAKPVGRVDEATIAPGESITDVLLFERPIGTIKPMQLDLPGANVGYPRPYQFNIAPDVVEQ